MFVYKITNRVNGKLYIGLTRKSVSIRFMRHCSDAKYYGKKSRISIAIRKHGADNFEVEVIDSAISLRDLCEKERYWIAFYGSRVPNGYNLTAGGEGTGLELEETRAERINRQTKKPLSEETRRRMSEAQKQLYSNGHVNYWKGKKRGPASEAARKLHSIIMRAKAKRGHKRPDFSANVKAHQASPGYLNSMLGKKRPDLAARNRSEESRERSRQVGLKNKGRVAIFTPEHRAKIAASKAINKAKREEAKRTLQMRLIID